MVLVSGIHGNTAVGRAGSGGTAGNVCRARGYGGRTGLAKLTRLPGRATRGTRTGQAGRPVRRRRAGGVAAGPPWLLEHRANSDDLRKCVAVDGAHHGQSNLTVAAEKFGAAASGRLPAPQKNAGPGAISSTKSRHSCTNSPARRQRNSRCQVPSRRLPGVRTVHRRTGRNGPDRDVAESVPAAGARSMN